MSGGFRTLDVLVLDDNLQMLQLMRTMLRAIGVDVTRMHSSVPDALASIYKAPPDLIFTDWEMTPISGLDFVHQLRAAENRVVARLPIVMVTAHGDKQLVLEARDAGINEFLVKPVSLKGLASRISAVMRAPREFVTTSSYVGPDRRRAQLPFDGPDRRIGSNLDFDGRDGLERLREAEQAIAALKQRFEDSLCAGIDVLRSKIEALRVDQPEQEACAAAFRIAHDYKGQGASFGYPLISEFATMLCKLLRDRDKVSDRELALIRFHVDAMKTVAQNRIRGDGGEIGRALTNSLAGLVTKLST